MPYIRPVLFALSLSIALAALASCAEHPSAAAPAAAAVSTSNAVPAAAAAPAAAGTVATSGATTAAANAAAAKTTGAATDFKPPGGWSARVMNGETVYCRKETTTGSRIPTQTCLTQPDLKELMARGQKGAEDLDRMRRGASTQCGAATCN
jgi:hypothetical protein